VLRHVCCMLLTSGIGNVQESTILDAFGFAVPFPDGTTGSWMFSLILFWLKTFRFFHGIIVACWHYIWIFIVYYGLVHHVVRWAVTFCCSVSRILLFIYCSRCIGRVLLKEFWSVRVF
jgi:hypothetical protein